MYVKPVKSVWIHHIEWSRWIINSKTTHTSDWQNLNPKIYSQLANEIGLDLEKFEKDRKDPELTKIVEADYQQAVEIGLDGTPGFFVNGVFVNGAKSVDYFKGIIDRWLKQLEQT